MSFSYWLKEIPNLETLILWHCESLALQSLPPTLWILDASDCGSLKSASFSFYEPGGYITVNDHNCLKLEKEAMRVSSSLYDPDIPVMFPNCFSLDEEARRVIIQRWAYKCVWLPGKEVPVEFTHKATGNSITISSGTFSTSSRFKACLLISPIPNMQSGEFIVCCLRSKGVVINELKFRGFFLRSNPLVMERHLFVFSGELFKEHICLEVDATTSEIQFEFSCQGNDGMITECGVLQILEEEDETSIQVGGIVHSDGAVQVSKDESVFKSSKHRGWWNWLSLRIFI
ncbi:unnamed protein product [Arabis nemorensis]|uniref:Uncharacterized protein n=1 Tax=Arabis nemorensis TaxID=586526 RepID=A0A565C7A8_9BRAS|nr:unnamed protein product [Arabis nemorensis]